MSQKYSIPTKPERGSSSLDWPDLPDLAEMLIVKNSHDAENSWIITKLEYLHWSLNVTPK